MCGRKAEGAARAEESAEGRTSGHGSALWAWAGRRLSARSCDWPPLWLWLLSPEDTRRLHTSRPTVLLVDVPPMLDCLKTLPLPQIIHSRFIFQAAPQTSYVLGHYFAPPRTPRLALPSDWRGARQPALPSKDPAAQLSSPCRSKSSGVKQLTAYLPA